MSLNTVIAFALLLKKITRKGSMGKKHFRNKFNKKDSSCSSSEDEEDDNNIIVVEYDNNDDYHLMNKDNKTNSSIISPPSIKSIQKHVSLKPLEITAASIIVLPQEESVVVIRDFAYPIDHPYHHGKAIKHQSSSMSLSSPDFNGRDARALFDFTPETEYELPLKQGQTLWVQYRQCPGWLVADVQDETGLIPETYVEFI
ncbi:uncharacterized protein EV154DRAFT_523109 [Mucor mucedo]|uniref:SH3 domain-containing protein n=1 Tax=Mucor saturninus TaxID=64648 RepID=A0A8H7R2U9_9FUNG|nr:uncharacterized protein EV154DRAFT_523109 [Mucor mucedo]KAG2202885.1 hypothetical protein INT47_008917 [Mucor saturninus]KAI7882104.1 hypothetical protein EV154DRAFT_523109 [Mucor mucedo]